MKSIINWRIFGILLFMSVISVFAVFPYVLTLQGDVIRQLDVPISTLVLVQTLQSIILFSVSIFFGLFLTDKIGFRLPLLEALMRKSGVSKDVGVIGWHSVRLGFVAASLIYAVDYIFGFSGTDITVAINPAPAWQKLLAALYGGITEEILLRLFVMSLFVWIGMRITRKEKPSDTGVFVSIILSSIVFGLGHLPITSSLTVITPLIVIRAVVLNGIGGIFFGWLFWKKGLESAMIAHFTADIFLLTVLPLAFSLFRK